MTLAGWSRKLKSRSRGNDGPRALPPLFLMTDDTRLANPARAIAHLPKGSGVVFRHYGAAHRERLALELAALCHKRGLMFLVAGDAALARRAGAHGIHLPEAALRHRLPPCRAGWIVTAAAHSLPAALKARRMGVDAVLISPVFLTKSHPGAQGLGARRLAIWTRQVGIPVYALGGVTDKTARKLNAINIAGVAAIGGLTP